MNYDITKDCLGLEYNKHIILKSNITQKEYAVIIAVNGDNTTQFIVDKSYLEDNIYTEFSQVFRISNGYPIFRTSFMSNNIKIKSVHQHIMGNPIEEGLNIDHINWRRNDNRRENLRFATMSQQNSNRATRVDKVDPPEIIKNLGITKLPRYMRWDEGEKKFRVEIPNYKNSATKAKNVSIINRFRDAVIRTLDVLNEDQEFIDIVYKKMPKKVKK
jgi:hypothetical protein